MIERGQDRRAPSRASRISLAATTGYALILERVAASRNEWTEISGYATCYTQHGGPPPSVETR